MKRIRFALFIILSSLLIPVLSFAPIPKVKGAEQVFFEDNFENYNVGAFPSSGGWELWYNGAGTEQQVIVDNVSVSPTKSLKLLGLNFWAGFAAKRFTSSSSTIGFEVAVRVEETNGQSRDNARVAFTKKLSSSISSEYAPVTFQDSGVIASGGQVLQSYVADTWYKIKLIMDRASETYSVWVDGELKGENLSVTNTSGDMTAFPSSEIAAFSVSQCYNSVTVYFDDVKVFSVYDADPKLELVPNTGITTTTLVGSGFAPNSEIYVTWDGISIPTVPSPLTTDGYGSFTGIISALNQTTWGIYTIRAVDETGNAATATFTVTLELQSQKQITVPDDYPTIQEAINHAQEGDTIIVKAGTYYENVIVNKGLTIESQSGAETTIVCTADPETKKTVFEITADNVVLKGFTITVMVGWGGDGIYLNEVENCVISDNICFDKSAGIFLYNSHNNLIANNNVSNNRNGLYLHQSNNNRIISNIASKSSYGRGIRLVFSSYNEILNNTANENQDSGIDLIEYHTNYNLIASNTLKSNRISGISLCHAENNIISANNFLNNGVAISSWGTSKNSTIVHNNFIDNTVSVTNSEKNVLDAGYPSGGNYWSDYNGTDMDGDGIGDVPYVIDETNQDNYPLMSPNSATPSFSYMLIVDSLPSGVTFTTDNTLCTAPWSETYNENTTVSLTMPESYSYEGEKYTWSRWSDGNTNRKRTVTMNENIALTALFAPEDTALVISMLSPENRTYSVTDIPLKYAVNRFFYVTTYSLDGQANVTVIGNTTLTGLSEGQHSIVIYIEARPENISSSETIYFTVASAKGFSILSPENKTYNTADIPLTYTKNETCYYIGYSLDGQLYTDTQNTTLTGLADGAHQLMFYANYSDSYMGEFATVWFSVDTAPPTITDVIQTPIDVNGTLGEGVRVNATVTDSVSGVERVSLNYTDGNGTWMIAEMAQLEGDVWNGTIPTFPHGTTLTYTIIAEDKAGNTVTTEELYGHPNQYEVLPEFPLWIILPLFLIATASTIVTGKRLTIPSFAKISNKLNRLLNLNRHTN